MNRALFLTLIFWGLTTLASAQTPSQTLPDTTLANQYFARGEELAKQAQYDSALVYLQKASSIYEKNAKWVAYVRGYNKMGECALRKGAFDQAMEWLNHALNIGVQRLGEQHREMATNYNNTGWVYWQKGDYDQALEFHQKSLDIRLTTLGEQHPEVARSYNNIGNVYSVKGDYERALEFYQKSLNIRLTVLGEKHLDVAASYNNIGNVYWNKGDHERALEFYQKSLHIRLTVLGEQHPDVAASYNNIGTVYSSKSDYEPALEYLQKSLNIKLTTFGELHYSVALSYNNIGEVYYKKGDYVRALEFHQKTLNIGLAILGEQHPEVVNSYNNIGNVYYQKGDYTQALRNYQKALRANASGFKHSDPYRNPSLDHLLSEERMLETLQFKTRTLVQRHAAFGKLDDLQAAFSTSQLLVQLIDRMRSGYKAEGSKLFLAEKASAVYEQAIETARKLYDITGGNEYRKSAFFFAEKAKAAVLWEALLDSRAKQFAGIPDSLLAKERELKIDLAYYGTRIQEEKRKPEKRDSRKISEFENRYFDLNRRYEKLIEQFERDYPKYYALKYQTRGITISELQPQLDEQTSILEYFAGDSTIYVFTISKTQFDVTKLPKDTLLESQIKQLRLGITRNQHEGDYQLYTRNAYQLYQKLFQPIEPRLRGQKLLIIPDGTLNNIPFETLLSADVAAAKTIDYRALPYLMKKYLISYAYSANLFAATTAQPLSPPPYDYLAFAPVFVEGLASDSRGTDLLEGNHALDSTRTADKIYLPASKQEVLGIEQLFQKSYDPVERLLKKKTRVYLEKEANEENFKRAQLQNYRYLHLATHGFANKNTPDLSGLLLAHKRDSAEDGVLHLPEIYNLDLNADLAVVSACESGTGKLAKGEGLIGLTRGFVYAGARNLLVSLWKVNDWSTADLMLTCYTQMLQGKSKAEALRDAKQHLMQSNPDYARPYYWAPFILIGR
jgi:CHAT domain-containing protein/Tfp pilus assembly protein PilF